MTVSTLEAFNEQQKILANDLLSAKVATMLGRKMEENDWDFVYCHAKGLPMTDWSNLHIDVSHEGLGVEHKMFGISKQGSILDECGTSKMHPAGTRSIRIPDTNDPNEAMIDILSQYNELIDSRRKKVADENKTSNPVDIRTGWLLWKRTLDEFLYFEEKMERAEISDLYAQWNETPAKGSRKSSRSLWIYNKITKKKVYSVTTTAGAKVQPYFDVPLPDDPNLYHFKVQGVSVDEGLIKVWLTNMTANYLKVLLGGLDKERISEAIAAIKDTHSESINSEKATYCKDVVSSIAVPVIVHSEDYAALKNKNEYISDEYMFQQLATEYSRLK